MHIKRTLEELNETDGRCGNRFNLIEADSVLGSVSVKNIL